MSKKGYKYIVAEKLPSRLEFKRRIEYDECVKEFLEGEVDSARVVIPGVKPKTLARILIERVKKQGLNKQVMVSIRKDRIYLVRLKQPEPSSQEDRE